MTFSTDFVLLAIAAACLILALGGARFLDARTERLRRFERSSEMFHRAARPLLSDVETPAVVLILLQFLNNKISTRSAARHAFLAILRGNLNDVSPRINSMPEFKEFSSRRQELAKSFNSACAAALLAISYRSLIWGWLLRRLILFDVKRDSDRAERLAAELAEFSGTPVPAHC